jgi:hypothetical protein
MLVSLVERGCQGCGRARPFWACQEKHSCIHPSARKVHSANFALTEFSEVRVQDPYPLVRHASPLVRPNPPLRLGDAKDGIWENAPVRLRCNQNEGVLWVTSEENKRVYARYIDLFS